MTDTNELRKLLEKATPGPWAVSYGDESWAVVGTKPDGTPDLWARRTVFDDGSAAGEYGPSCKGPTRDLIVAAVNALPALLDELLAARAEVARLRDMLALLCAAVEHSAPGYGVYEDWCDITDHDILALRERMIEAKALLAKHKETP